MCLCTHTLLCICARVCVVCERYLYIPPHTKILISVLIWVHKMILNWKIKKNYFSTASFIILTDCTPTRISYKSNISDPSSKCLLYLNQYVVGCPPPKIRRRNNIVSWFTRIFLITSWTIFTQRSRWKSIFHMHKDAHGQYNAAVFVSGFLCRHLLV